LLAVRDWSRGARPPEPQQPLADADHRKLAARDEPTNLARLDRERSREIIRRQEPFRRPAPIP
jgi:hypothetical protein